MNENLDEQQLEVIERRARGVETRSAASNPAYADPEDTLSLVTEVRALRAELNQLQERFEEECRWSRGWKDLAHRTETERDRLLKSIRQAAYFIHDEDPVMADVLYGMLSEKSD